MKKNQERRLHRKNAKIVKEGGTPMQLNRPVKPDTTVSSIFSPPMVGCLFSMYSFQRRCGHCGQMGHMSRCIYHISFQLLLLLYPSPETNRKCPRWAEFNSGTPPMPATPSAGSPPATSPTGPSAFGFGKSDSLFSPGASPGPSNTLLRAPNALASASHGPSPLATSPPMIAMEEEDESVSTPTTSAPKLKLTLKKP